jgi:hypothetical protein
MPLLHFNFTILYPDKKKKVFRPNYHPPTNPQLNIKKNRSQKLIPVVVLMLFTEITNRFYSDASNMLTDMYYL